MKKVFILMLSLLYFFTAQLSVHAFTMHPASHGSDHHHEEKKPDCGHPQPTHDHGSHDKKDSQEDESNHDGHDMSMCMEQSIGVFLIDTLELDESDYILPVLKYTNLEQDRIDQYFYSLHDPGRGQDGTFSEFLNNDLYGHGIIMHC